jgi:hypothetical protein
VLQDSGVPLIFATSYYDALKKIPRWE